MELVRVNEMLPDVEAIECTLADAEVSERLGEEVRAAIENLKRKSDQWRPFEELHALMLRISDHLDQKSSEQKAVYNCLRTIEESTRETNNTIRVIAFVVATVAGFWSAVAWWIWREEIRSLFYAAANLMQHSFAEFFSSMH
jgi:hypothetical protein